MTDLNSIRLGKSKNSTNFNPDDMKNGLALNDFTNTNNTSIFNSNEAESNPQLANDYKTIFEALDKGGNVKGVLEESEINALKNKIKTASGNNIFSKREALKLLNSLGLNNIKVETFFSFLKNAINFSKKIESTETNNGITTTKYVAENGFQQTVTRDSNGNISKTVIKNISDNTYVIKDGKGNIISGQDKDGEYTRTEIGDGKYKIQRGEYFVTYQNINGENVEIGGKDKDGKYTRTELEDGKYKIQRGEYFVTYQNINGKNVIIGGKDEDGEYTRTELEDGKYAQTYTDENNLRRKTRVQTFNSNNKLLSDVVTDAKGRLTEKTVYERNEKGDCTKKTEYDADGNVTEVQVEEYTYDDNGNRTKETSTEYDADGNVTDVYIYEYTYDDNGNWTKRTITNKDADGNVTNEYVSEYTYDDKGNMTKDTTTCKKNGKEDGKVTETDVWEYTYDDNGNRTKETRTEYDADGNVTEVQVEEYTYDDNGNRTKRTITNKDADGNVTNAYVDENTYTYDDNGSITKETNTFMDKDRNVLQKTVRNSNNLHYWLDCISPNYSNSLKHDKNEYSVQVISTSCLRIKNNNKYNKNLPGKIGDYITTAKNGETFAETMKRLGITEEADKQLFIKANPKALARGRGDINHAYFIVGELDVVIPKALAEKLDIKNNIEKYIVNVEDEIDNYEFCKDKRPAVSP